MIRDTIAESTENTNPNISSLSNSKIIDDTIADLRSTIDQLAILNDDSIEHE